MESLISGASPKTRRSPPSWTTALRMKGRGGSREMIGPCAQVRRRRRWPAFGARGFRTSTVPTRDADRYLRHRRGSSRAPFQHLDRDRASGGGRRPASGKHGKTGRCSGLTFPPRSGLRRTVEGASALNLDLEPDQVNEVCRGRGIGIGLLYAPLLHTAIEKHVFFNGGPARGRHRTSSTCWGR